MKERIIEILGKIGRPKDLDDINSPAFWLEDAADEILRIAEFEALCNPDLYEAHMNEDIEERMRKDLLMEFRDYYFNSGLGVICESDIDGFLDNCYIGQ